MADPKQKLNDMIEKQQKLIAAQRVEAERLAKEKEQRAIAEKVQRDLIQSQSPNK